MFGKLIVIGSAVLSLGTIHETGGSIERQFWLFNESSHPVAMVQGYGSCGCTTISFPKDSVVNPGDSVMVTLRFDPMGKGGEFYESATIQYHCTDCDLTEMTSRPRVSMAIEGTCITSEETLALQHPNQITPTLRVSTLRFDLGYLNPGDSRERTISIWHKDTGTTESRTLTFTATGKTPKGINHVPLKVEADDAGKKTTFAVTFDVIVR